MSRIFSPLSDTAQYQALMDIDIKNSMVINYEAHMADPVARWIGWNDPTGGIVPQTEPIVVKTVSGFPLKNRGQVFNL